MVNQREEKKSHKEDNLKTKGDMEEDEDANTGSIPVKDGDKGIKTKIQLSHYGICSKRAK